ncbi:MAG: DUF58 domain-containing protein [Deltaproteobacteria bacterium]|nr:DUF58 domain-containing protein [Deltaproteobacteria bacterium]
MLSKEVLQKIRLIDIQSKYLANEVFAGEYESAFRGRGMEFEEVREYQIGDDIRSIDWNVTARMEKPFVKVFREERELSVFFMVDASASQSFGSGGKQKREVCAEIAALLAYAALRSNDKIGLMIFTEEVEKYIPPKKGSGHVWQVIKEILSFEAKGKKTNLKGALEFAAKVVSRRSVCFLLSDFLADFLAQNYEQALGIASRKHDLIALAMSDALEEKIPPLGWMQFKDLETDESCWLDSRGQRFQEYLFQQKIKRQLALKELFRSQKVDACFLESGKDYATPLLELFRKREKRL